MKNIITMLLILIIPLGVYFFMTKNPNNISAIAQDRNNPSLLIFTSTMCLDCQKVKSTIKEIEENYNDKINFIQINALDKNKKVQEKIKKHKVTLVPTLVFIDVNGNEINKIEGALPKEELISEIEELING